MLDQKLTQKIGEYYDKCKALADYVTENQELGMQEKLAAAAYKKLLEEEGFEVEAPFCGIETSFLAVKKNRKNDTGKKALFMCEYDALAGLGHACGHSLSGAASVLAALALHAAYPDLPVRMDLIGTPGEEYPGGKVMLVDKGAFKGYEFAEMAHMSPANSPTFNVLACNDRYITFKGKAAHASANPQAGVNALNAARLYWDAMDMWRQHLPRGAQFHGVVAKGGDNPGIVPDDIELNMYFRGVTLQDLDRVCDISDQCAKGAAIASGCEYTSVQQYLTFADLYNTPTGNKLVCGIFNDMGEPYFSSDIPAGSTDAGNVDYHIPVFHPMVNISHGPFIPIHTPEFRQLVTSETGAAGFRNAATLLANLACQLASAPETLQAIQQENKAYRQRR